MIATISQKMELRFWDLVIVMLSGSKTIQSVVRSLAGIYQNESLRKKIALCLVIACGGFGTGILAFTLASFL